MKITVTLFLLLAAHSVFAQNNLIRIGFMNNLDLWKPYTANVGTALKANNVRSNTWSANLQFLVVSKPRISWSAGISYKRINYQVKDRIKLYNYYYLTGNMGVTDTHYVSHIYTDPADLKSHSNSLGILNEVDHPVFKRKILTGSIGILSEIYLFENYSAAYSSDDSFVNGDVKPVGPTPEMEKTSRNIFISSANTSLFFKAMLHGHANNVSLSAKASVGTNVYSNWDQFSKYAWLGLGLELGFGKRKVKTKKENL